MGLGANAGSASYYTSKQCSFLASPPPFNFHLWEGERLEVAPEMLLFESEDCEKAVGTFQRNRCGLLTSSPSFPFQFQVSALSEKVREQCQRQKVYRLKTQGLLKWNLQCTQPRSEYPTCR